MAARLEHLKPPPQPGLISRFEQGKREPSLLVLLEYARIAGVPMELLVDDKSDLPQTLPLSSTDKKRQLKGAAKRK
jgi:transcriptional regulator with XRE-family HTH domain